MRFFGGRFTVFVFVLAPWLVHAGGDEVVVIYNNRMPGSKLVAEHYAQMRRVPEAQIYGLDLPITDEMTRAEFRDELQFPLASRLVVDNLWQFGSVTNAATNGHPARVEPRVIESKIRYAVLCYGVPLKIAPDPDLHEPGRENVRPELLRNEAAVDSELAWLPLLKMDIPLSGPLPNWACGAALILTRGDCPKATPIIFWATNGYWARGKSAANWVLKPSWTKIPPRSPPIFQ